MSVTRARAYTEAGVNIEAGNSLVERIKSMVAQTHVHGVLSDIGGFGGLFRPDLGEMEDPVLVASTDGVGTKLKLATAFDKHDTIGIDLVAMSVNDILVQGARPLFFLDYFASGKLDVDRAAQVIQGVAEGCKISGCALLGGETAEMPDMYAPGDYDLAGFCVGLVDNAKIIDGHGARHSVAAHAHLYGSGAQPDAGSAHQGHDPHHGRRLLRQYPPRASQFGAGRGALRFLVRASGLPLAARAGRSFLAGNAADFQLRHRVCADRSHRGLRGSHEPSCGHARRGLDHRLH